MNMERSYVLSRDTGNIPFPVAPSLPNLRFAHDRRLQDVERLLQYNRPRTIKLEDRPNMR